MKFINWKKFLIGLVALVNFLMVPLTLAQGTLLPKAGSNCDLILNTFVTNGSKMSSSSTASDGTITTTSITGSIDDLLGCAIQTGRISLPMVPYFIRYFSNFLLGIISLIALLMIVFGGFWYTSSGMIEQKDKGKTFIKNAIMGMIYAFLAWSIVNVILAAITG